MKVAVFYQVYREETLLGSGECEAPFILGRQEDEREAKPVSVSRVKDLPKLVIAPFGNRHVSRKHLQISVDASGKLIAKNIHPSMQLVIHAGGTLAPGAEYHLGDSGLVGFPDEYLVRFSLKAELGNSNQSPNDSFCNYQWHSTQGSLLSMLAKDPSEQPIERRELAVRLVKTALEAFKEPVGSDAFFAAAAVAALQMIEVDRVLVLQKQAGNWLCRSSATSSRIASDGSETPRFSRSLLQKMEAAGKTTVVEPPVGEQAIWVSMGEIDRAVASPILDVSGGVVGALYGDRDLGGALSDNPISELEAAMFEVIASGISSSLAVEREQHLRSSMTQFFSPLVLSQLERDPDLLSSRETDVSVLFCDIRGFSAVTEKIGPSKAIHWINDVLTVLSECVLAHDGVLVDYVGDELMAMWGAPGSQPDHAIRACRAALDMLDQIAPLTEKWREVISAQFGFGIGISSGLAGVGNTGSKKKFKYGPLGNTVNLASRVQGITKQIRVPGLISGDTARAARSADFQMRRLAKVRVVGICQPIDLFQLCARGEDRSDLCRRFEEALRLFEANDLRNAAVGLSKLVQDYPDDGPTIILLSRVVSCLTQEAMPFDPVWNLTQK